MTFVIVMGFHQIIVVMNDVKRHTYIQYMSYVIRDFLPIRQFSERKGKSCAKTFILSRRNAIGLFLVCLRICEKLNK